MVKKIDDILDRKGFDKKIPPNVLREVGQLVISRQSTYQSNSQFQWYKKRVDSLQKIVNQEMNSQHQVGRYGIVDAGMRVMYDYYVDKLRDIFNEDNLAVLLPVVKSEETQNLATDLQKYTNNLLNSRPVSYKRHLFDRFKYLPTYGWSPARDYYNVNNGWAVKASAKEYAPGLEKMLIGAEVDDWQSSPKSQCINPFNWFGDSFNTVDNCQWQGESRRFYISDIDNALGQKDYKGEAVYNVEVLTKVKQRLARGEKIVDGYRYQQNAGTSPSQGSKEYANTPAYCDVICYTGTIDTIKYFSDNDDSNKYYLEVTPEGEVIRFETTPLDRITMFTHLQTHPMIECPYSRSWLDLMVDTQVNLDILKNSQLENAVDSMRRFWFYDETQLVNPEDFESPPGLTTLIRSKLGGAKPPQLLQGNVDASFKSITELIESIKRDKEAYSVSLQEMGSTGGGTGRTATQANILKTASALKIRGAVNNFAPEVAMQMKNLTFLSMCNDSEDITRTYLDNGQPFKLSKEHVNFFLHGSELRLCDSVTKDFDDVSQRMTQAGEMMAKVLPNLANPEHMVHWTRSVLRYAKINQADIDLALPAPAPIDSNNPERQQIDKQQQVEQQSQQLQAQMQQAQQQNQELQAQLQQLTMRNQLLESKNEIEMQKLEIERLKLGMDMKVAEEQLNIKKAEVVGKTMKHTDEHDVRLEKNTIDANKLIAPVGNTKRVSNFRNDFDTGQKYALYEGFETDENPTQEVR